MSRPNSDGERTHPQFEIPSGALRSHSPPCFPRFPSSRRKSDFLYPVCSLNLMTAIHRPKGIVIILAESIGR